jgi:septum site-determining protein MinD
MGKVIVVASGKGGTGKTTSVGAIASCLAALGHKTLCLDCDAGLRNLDIIIGMTEYTVTDFTDVLEGRIGFMEACAEHPRIKNLYFLSAPAFRGPEDIETDAMPKLLDQIRAEFEYCLLDAPAGIGPGFRLAVQGADMALIIATGDITSIRDGQRVAEELKGLGLDEIRLVINRISPRSFRLLGSTVDDMIDAIGARLLGLVEEDEAVYLSSNSETPLVLYEDKRAALEFLQITRRLVGERIPLARKWSRA